MKKILIVNYLCSILAIILTSQSYAQTPPALYNRAPDVMPGTIPEMRTPEFWIARMEKPDEIILPLNEIERRNEAYRKFVSRPNPFEGVSAERIPIQYFYPGTVLNPPDFHSLGGKAAADSTKARIQAEIDYLLSREWGNAFGVKYAKREILEIIDEMDKDAVGKNIEIRDGIAVKICTLRNVPAFYPQKVGAAESGNRRWDRWSIGVLKIGKPVTVLHVSKSGEYLFVLTHFAYGWIRSEDIAFVSREQIKQFTKPKNFVVCTGNRVQFYTDKTCKYSTGCFMMGDKLPIVSENSPIKITIPVRQTDGNLTTDSAYISPDADVNIGYLPYNRRNIVTQAFKMLDDLYDFTGALLGRQHETIYRDIFTCFGFDLPMTDPMFTFYGNDETVVKPEAGKETQYKAILSHEPFVTLQSCGRHGQLFLGEYNGEPIVFDHHGYDYKDENGNLLEVMRCNIGTLMLPEYFLKRNITFLELK